MNGSAQRSVGSALRLRATLPIVGDGCHWGGSSRLTLIVRAALVATVLSSACASRAARPAAPHSLPPSAGRVVTVPTAVSVPAFAPIETTLRLFDDYTARGEAALDRGQFDEARRRFAAAVALVLEVRTTLPSTVASRRLDDAIDRVRALEQSASSARRSRSGVDDLLAVATLEPPDEDPLSGVVPELPVLPAVSIPLNEKLQSAIRALSVRRADAVAQGLTRAGRYLPMIREVLVRQGLPPELAFLPLVESAFKPKALSRASAHGMWQFMRGTARENGLKVDWYIDERADPEKATAAAARYLRALYGLFDGDWLLALAAYNGGPGRVQRAMRRSGADDFWTLAASSRYLPRETRNFVPLALAAMRVGLDPARYGFDLTPDPPLRYAKVSVPNAIDLARVAEWSGVPLEVVQDLNPELRRWMTPFGYPGYQVKVPVEAADALARRMATASPSDLITPRWHVVVQGESLWRIARNMNISRVDLASVNRLSPSAQLRIGQRLLIPGGAAARPTPSSPERASGPRPTVTGAELTPQRRTYQVQVGDTLYGIARLFRTTVASLKVWNQLRSNLIKPGDRLTILSR